MGLSTPGLNRSSSGSTLSSLSVRVIPSSPASGSAAAAYALSAGLDSSPASSSPRLHSLTVSSLPSSSAPPPPFDDPDGDIPSIVECYENQRYYPVAGWSARLLPTDRPAWSNDEGTQARQFTDFKCPIGWQWTSEWTIERGAGGDGEGWSYAVEFTREWKGEAVKGGKHLVRRRRWVRKRQANNRGGSAPRPTSNTLSVGGGTGPAITQPNNSLTVGSRPTRPPVASNSLTVQGGGRAPAPPPPVSLITRLGSSASPLSSLYAPSGDTVARKVVMLVKVVEYQRYYPIVGWKDQLLPTDPKPSWEDTQGRRREGKESIDANEKRRPTPQTTPRTSGGSRGSLSLGGSPGKGSTGGKGREGEGESVGGVKEEEVGEERWEWLGEWKVDVTPSTDKDGWLYAVDFNHARWGHRKGVEHFIRKRVWVREKARPEKAKDINKVVADLMWKLERWENDIDREAKHADLIDLAAATW